MSGTCGMISGDKMDIMYLKKNFSKKGNTGLSNMNGNWALEELQYVILSFSCFVTRNRIY